MTGFPPVSCVSAYHEPSHRVARAAPSERTRNGVKCFGDRRQVHVARRWTTKILTASRRAPRTPVSREYKTKRRSRANTITNNRARLTTSDSHSGDSGSSVRTLSCESRRKVERAAECHIGARPAIVRECEVRTCRTGSVESGDCHSSVRSSLELFAKKCRENRAIIRTVGEHGGCGAE